MVWCVSICDFQDWYTSVFFVSFCPFFFQKSVSCTLVYLHNTAVRLLLVLSYLKVLLFMILSTGN